MEKLQAILTLEILGRPANHIKEALANLTTRLGAEKGVNLLKKTIHEPIPVKESKTLFTTFAELEVEFESIENYFAILFAYMPAHIEIIQPEKISLLNHDFNEVGNKIIQRLHDYDAITKRALVEKDALVEKLREVAPHLFKKPETIQPQKKKAKKKRSK